MWRRPVVTILMLIISVILTLPMRAQQKPFTKDQVSNMVRAGLGDESGAKLVEQRGIDFAPAEHFLQTLNAAGANEAFLKALRAAKPPEPASAKKPLNQVQIFVLLAGQVASRRVAMLVQERGLDFEPQDDYLQEVRLGGGGDELITALKSAKVTKPATVDPAAQARQAEVRQHVARGAELKQKGQYAEAEQEYRAALLLDPHDADIYDSLAYVLFMRGKSDDAASAAREAIRLNPNSDTAHVQLGWVLGLKGNTDGEIAEYREALRLNPNNDLAHFDLASALAYRGDSAGAIGEYREGLRLDPDDAAEHYLFGKFLEQIGDPRGALEEYRAAHELVPEYGPYREPYERLLQQVKQ